MTTMYHLVRDDPYHKQSLASIISYIMLHKKILIPAERDCTMCTPTNAPINVMPHPPCWGLGGDLTYVIIKCPI